MGTVSAFLKGFCLEERLGLFYVSLAAEVGGTYK